MLETAIAPAELLSKGSETISPNNLRISQTMPIFAGETPKWTKTMHGDSLKACWNMDNVVDTAALKGLGQGIGQDALEE